MTVKSRLAAKAYPEGFRIPYRIPHPATARMFTSVGRVEIFYQCRGTLVALVALVETASLLPVLQVLSVLSGPLRFSQVFTRCGESA